MAGAGKLAYVCHIFPYLTQTFVYREVEELKRSGIALTVFSMKPSIPALMSPESRRLTADTIYLPPVTRAAMIASQAAWLLRAPRRYLQALALVARGKYRFNNTLLLWLHGIVDFARGAHLARLLVQDGQFCHLYAQFADDACTTTMVASMLTGIPFSFRSHTSPNPQALHEKVRRAQFVAAASLYDKRVLVHWCGERTADKIHVNRLGVPLDRYKLEMGVQVIGCSAVKEGQAENLNTRMPEHLNTSPLILSVGTLIPEKGFEYVIRACRLLADRGIPFNCLIVGDGPDRAKLEELVALLNLGDRVTLSPYRPQEEVRRLFQQAAVFTLPCIFPLNGNVDVIPLVLQEAMAMARPVVSTPVSGIPELILDGVNGLLAPEKDHEALAEALARILQDPELAARLGAAARETVVQRFDIAINGADLAEIFLREVPDLGVQAVRRSGGPVDPPEDPNARTLEHRNARPRLRVAWVAEIPVPYRMSLYRRLREEAGLDLRLLFCSTTQKDRAWTVALDDVPNVVLPGVTIPLKPAEQFFLRINPRVWRELSLFKPDVVVVGGYAHVTMQLAMLWCRRTGTPYLINSESHGQGRGQGSGTRDEGRGMRDEESQRPSSPAPIPHPSSLIPALKRFFIRGAAAGLPAGTLAREYLVSQGGRPERMFSLPNSCDVGRFAQGSGCARSHRASVREAYGLGPGPVALYVGRLTRVKGLDTLLRAFAEIGYSGIQKSGCTGAQIDNKVPLNTRIPEYLNTLPVLLLVGDGEQRGELEALASRLGIEGRVRFAGSRPWPDLPALYAAADLFVLPSLYEPWGAVVLEAMSSGLPVIVSDQVGCAPDLVHPGENGWIVPAGDEAALAASLREALTDPQRSAAMGAASSRLAPAWGEEACLESFVSAVEAAVSSTTGWKPGVLRTNSQGSGARSAGDG